MVVNSKSGFFNVQVTAGAEKGIISGEISVSNGVINFQNIEVVSARGGLGTIQAQNTIGASTFLNLQKELTEISKAGGYNKGTIEFSRLHPSGSKLPDTETRVITLFDNTKK